MVEELEKRLLGIVPPLVTAGAVIGLVKMFENVSEEKIIKEKYKAKSIYSDVPKMFA